MKADLKLKASIMDSFFPFIVGAGSSIIFSEIRVAGNWIRFRIEIKSWIRIGRRKSCVAISPNQML